MTKFRRIKRTTEFIGSSHFTSVKEKTQQVSIQTVAYERDIKNRSHLRECDVFIIIFLLESFLAPKARQAVGQ